MKPIPFSVGDAVKDSNGKLWKVLEIDQGIISLNALNTSERRHLNFNDHPEYCTEQIRKVTLKKKEPKC
jgi:hypothetical protein